MFTNRFNFQDGNGSSASAGSIAKLNIPSLVLGLVGFGVSLYALTLHMQTKASTQALTCDINDAVNCSKVIGGEYGEFMGLPLGALGMSYFGIVMAMAFVPAFLQASESWMARRQLIVATVGASVSLFLAYVSYFKVGAVCLVCTSVHAISILNFIWTLICFLKVRTVPQIVGQGGSLKLLAAGLALAIPPLLVGALLPTISSVVGGEAKSVPTPANEVAESSGAATPFPSEWLQIARSNYVGKGEDYRIGNEQAKVVVHMFSDMQCPHCKVASEDIAAAMSAVGEDRVLFVYRNYPLSNKCNANVASEGHPYACEMAMAARCAGSQKKDAFWELKTWAFSGIDMSPEEQAKQFSPEGFSAQAKKLNLDVARFESCLKDKVEIAKIQDDVEIGKKMGLTGTPLIVINGRKYSGEQGPRGFTRAFREALEAK
ncbi:MAG: vitamin K epoxide reductase family protein [Silvanigrellaceae bacterium]